MSVTLDRGRYYWVKRVPKRYLGLVVGKDGQPVKQVRQALHTDSRAEAEAKAASVENARLAEWEAMRQGDAATARAQYAAAKATAEARGFPYQPIEQLAAGDLDQIVRRVLSLMEGQTLAPPQATAAVLGTVPVALPGLVEVFDDYLDLTSAKHAKKSDEQMKRFKNTKFRPIRNFFQVNNRWNDAEDKPTTDWPLDQITRDDAVAFRSWWADRVSAGEASPETANRDIGSVSEVCRTWIKLRNAAIPNPFEGLFIEVRRRKKKAGRPTFSRDWVADKLLAPGALSGLNDEAADVFLMVVNTGLNVAEIVDAAPSAWKLDAEIPHMVIEEVDREVKAMNREREIPLLGVSLDAARRIAARGGVTRYNNRASSHSALVNKYLRNNGLAETPKHTIYSLRHYVEDALLEAGVDDRVRADILGHEYKRPNYGDGGALKGRAAALAKIAL